MIHPRRYVNKAKYAPKITESEIKEDFEWAWPFAEGVQE